MKHRIILYHCRSACACAIDYSIEDYIDFHFERPGADLRYSIDDSKLRALGWKPEADFDEEIKEIIKYHRDNFIW